MSKDEAQILFDAADYMAEHGYCKYKLCDNEGRVCLVGAVNAAFGWHFTSFWRARENGGEDVRFTSKSGRLARAVQSELPAKQPTGLWLDPWNTAIEWNNAPDTTGEDVILVLKRAGNRLLEEGDRT